MEKLFASLRKTVGQQKANKGKKSAAEKEVESGLGKVCKLGNGLLTPPAAELSSRELGLEKFHRGCLSVLWA